MRPFVLFLPAALLLGCGGGGGPSPQADGEVIAALVAGTPDKAANAALAKDHFVAVPPAAMLRRYYEGSFEPASAPSVSSDTATVAVKVLAPDGTEKGRATWQFVKAGERWKLKDAPLP